MKFRVKMTLCMLGLLSLLFGLGGSFLISGSFKNSLEREKDVAYASYQTALSTLQLVSNVNQRLNYDDVSTTLAQLTEQVPTGWTALRIASGQNSIYEYGATAYLGEVDTDAQPGVCSFHYRSGPDGAHFLTLSGAFSAGDGSLYMSTAHDISFLFQSRQYQQQTFLRVFLVMAVLCAILSYSVSRVLSYPLDSLSKASRAIASGRLSYRTRVRSHDEIGAVAEDFNTMAAQLEQTVAELQDAVERQQQFMGSFAHELKTPMTSVIGYADLIRGRTLGPDEAAEAANYIFSEGQRLESLSLKLLDILVLRKNDIVLSRTEPAKLIQKLVEHLRPVYLQQNIVLSCDCEAGSCRLEPDLVRSLLMNLIDNARKAMERGGQIHIQSEMCPGGCRIRVLDNGRGIPPGAIAHLTEAFYRVDKSRSREQGGVGLGLTLCSDIVRLHNGTMDFENRPGGGACITVTLKGDAL